MNNGPSPANQQIYELAQAELTALASDDSTPTAEGNGLLGEDFGEIDLNTVPVPVTFREVVQQRRDEIERAWRAKAPLATIFLCGSTLKASYWLSLAQSETVQPNWLPRQQRRHGKAVR